MNIIYLINKREPIFNFLTSRNSQDILLLYY